MTQVRSLLQDDGTCAKERQSNSGYIFKVHLQLDQVWRVTERGIESESIDFFPEQLEEFSCHQLRKENLLSC